MVCSRVAAKLLAIIAISGFRLHMGVCTLIPYALLALVRAVCILHTVRCVLVRSPDLLSARSHCRWPTRATPARTCCTTSQLVCSSPCAISSHTHALACTPMYSLLVRSLGASLIIARARHRINCSRRCRHTRATSCTHIVVRARSNTVILGTSCNPTGNMRCKDQLVCTR